MYTANVACLDDPLFSLGLESTLRILLLSLALICDCLNEALLKDHIYRQNCSKRRSHNTGVIYTEAESFAHFEGCVLRAISRWSVLTASHIFSKRLSGYSDTRCPSQSRSVVFIQLKMSTCTSNEVAVICLSRAWRKTYILCGVPFYSIKVLCSGCGVYQRDYSIQTR